MITAERALELAEKVQKKMAPVKLQELSTEIELAAKTGALKITVDEELSQLVYQELENEGFDVEEIENDDTGKIVATVISWAD